MFLHRDNCMPFFLVLRHSVTHYGNMIQRRDRDLARKFSAALIDYAFAANNDWRFCSAAIFLAVAVNTHMHADHITGTGRLKCLLPGCKSMISRSSGAEADVLLEPNDQVQFGRHRLRVLPTPGHTEGQILSSLGSVSRCTPGNLSRVSGDLTRQNFEINQYPLKLNFISTCGNYIIAISNIYKFT